MPGGSQVVFKFNSGGILALFGSPLDYIKVQRQLEKVSKGSNASKGLSLFHWGRKIVSQKGYRGLYAGFSLHATMDVIGTATYFGVYESFKEYVYQQNKPDAQPVWVSLAGGGLAGALSWSLVFPADVVKSVLQKKSLEVDPKLNTIFKISRSLYDSGGFRRFYKGIAPQLIRSFGVHAINFMVYEKVLVICK